MLLTRLQAPFSPSYLFAAGEQGYWYDSSDLSSMYQDSTGTTPATAPGQGVADCPIGLRLDKRFGLARGAELATNLTSNNGSVVYSGGVATFTASATANAVNQSALTLGKTYEVTFRIVSIDSGSIRPNAGNAGSGASVATPGTYRQILICSGNTVAAIVAIAAPCTAVVDSISFKEIPGNHATQATAASRPTLSARYNLLLATAALSTQSVTVLAASYVLSFTGTGTVTLSGTSTAGPLVGTGANNRVSLTFTPTAGSLTLTVTGSVTLADLRLADDAAKAIPAYQAVTSATTYDTAGFPWYLATDGVDDGMVTNTIDFTGTDKMTVWAGVTKLSDAASGALLELSVTSSTTAGTFGLIEFVAGVGDVQSRSGGTTPGVGAATAVGTFPAPSSMVQTMSGDISAPSVNLRVNGVQKGVTTSTQGTGTYSSNPVYLYRRGGTSLPANVRDYGQIVRGAASTASQIAAAERYIARNMGLSI